MVNSRDFERRRWGEAPHVEETKKCYGVRDVEFAVVVNVCCVSAGQRFSRTEQMLQDAYGVTDIYSIVPVDIAPQEEGRWGQGVELLKGEDFSSRSPYLGSTAVTEADRRVKEQAVVNAGRAKVLVVDDAEGR